MTCHTILPIAYTILCSKCRLVCSLLKLTLEKHISQLDLSQAFYCIVNRFLFSLKPETIVSDSFHKVPQPQTAMTDCQVLLASR